MAGPVEPYGPGTGVVPRSSLDQATQEYMSMGGGVTLGGEAADTPTDETASPTTSQPVQKPPGLLKRAYTGAMNVLGYQKNKLDEATTSWLESQMGVPRGTYRGTSPGQLLASGIIPPEKYPGFLGGVGRGLIRGGYDLATDPLTYETMGLGRLRASGRAAEEALGFANAGEVAAEAGTTLTPEAAAAARTARLAEATAPAHEVLRKGGAAAGVVAGVPDLARAVADPTLTPGERAELAVSGGINAAGGGLEFLPHVPKRGAHPIPDQLTTPEGVPVGEPTPTSPHAYAGWAHPEKLNPTELAEATEAGAFPNLIRASGLTGDNAAVAERFAKTVEGSPDSLVSEYRKRYGNVVNRDNARELSDDYAASLETRGLYAGATRQPAAYVAGKVYDQILAEPPKPGQEHAVFLAGGTGAGKTSSIASLPEERAIADTAHVVVDSNLADVPASRAKIDKALAAGLDAQIFYVHSDPLDAWVNRVLPRSEKEGRAVGMDSHVRSYVGSLKTIQDLENTYANNPQVHIHLIDNTHGPGNATVMDPSELKVINYEPEDLKAQVNEALGKAYLNGQIGTSTFIGSGGNPADLRDTGLLTGAGLQRSLRELPARVAPGQPQPERGPVPSAGGAQPADATAVGARPPEAPTGAPAVPVGGDGIQGVGRGAGAPEEAQRVVGRDQGAQNAERVGAAPEAAPSATGGRPGPDQTVAVGPQVSWEATPHPTSHVLPGASTAPYELRQAYTEDIHKALLDRRGEDELASALRLGRVTAEEGPGLYKGEFNPGFQGQIQVEGKDALSAAEKDSVERYAAGLGLTMHQEAVAYHHPLFATTPAEANGLEFRMGQGVSKEQLASIYSRLKAANPGVADDIALVPTPAGMRALNFSNLHNTQFHELMKSAVEKGIPGNGIYDAKLFKSEGDLVYNNWGEHPNGEGYLERLRAPGGPDVSGALDNIRSRVQAVNERYSREYGWGDPGHFTPETHPAHLTPEEASLAAAARPGPPEEALPGGFSLDPTGVYLQAPSHIREDIENHARLLDPKDSLNHLANFTERIATQHYDKILSAIDSVGVNRAMIKVHEGDTAKGIPTLWALGWEPGQGTEIHDHMNSLAAVHVLRGGVGETVFKAPAGYVEAGKAGGFEAQEGTHFLPKDAVQYVKTPYIHIISGALPGRSVTLHAYYPPLEAMNYFKRSGDGKKLIWSGEWDETKPPEVGSQKVVPLGAKEAEALPSSPNEVRKVPVPSAAAPPGGGGGEVPPAPTAPEEPPPGRQANVVTPRVEGRLQDIEQAKGSPEAPYTPRHWQDLDPEVANISSSWSDQKFYDTMAKRPLSDTEVMAWDGRVNDKYENWRVAHNALRADPTNTQLNVKNLQALTDYIAAQRAQIGDARSTARALAAQGRIMNAGCGGGAEEPGEVTA